MKTCITMEKIKKRLLYVAVTGFMATLFVYIFYPASSLKNGVNPIVQDTLSNPVDSTHYLKEYKFTHPLVAKADSFHYKGMFDSASFYYNQAIQFFENENNKEGYISTLNDLGFNYIILNKNGEARHILQKALLAALKDLPEGHPLFASMYYSMGLNYRYMNKPDSALLFDQKTLSLQLKIFGRNNFNVAKTYIEIGNVHRWIRFDYYNAGKNFATSLDILEKISHPQKEEYVFRCYYNLATTNRLKGDYDKAIGYSFEALSIAKKLKDNSFVEFCFAIIANIYADMDDYKNAIDFFYKAIYENHINNGQVNNYLAIYYNNLGGVYIQLDDYRKAIEALINAQKNLNGNFSSLPDLSSNCELLGTAYQIASNFPLALYNYQKCLEIRLKYYGNKHLSTAQNYMLFGDLYLERGQIDSALYYYQKTIISGIESFNDTNVLTNPAFSTLNEKFYVIEFISKKAFALKEKYLHSGGIDYLQSSLASYLLADSLISAVKYSFNQETSKLFLSKANCLVYEQGVDCAYILHKKSASKEYIEKALHFFERNKYQLILENLNKAENINKAGIPDSIKEKEQNLQFESKYIKNRLATLDQREKDDSITSQSLQAQLFSISRELEKLNEYLVGKYPSYFQAKYVDQIATIEEVQKFSKANQTNVIQYLWGDSAVYALGVDGEAIRFLKIPATDPLKQRMREFNKLLCEGDVISQSKFVSFIQNSHTLYQKLVNPLLNKKKLMSKLVIIPDGPLAGTSFEAMIADSVAPRRVNYKNLDYLIHHYQISYGYSLSLLLKDQNEKKRNAHNILAFSYSGEKVSKGKEETVMSGKPKLQEILGATEEIKTLERLFKGKFFLGSHATEVNFKQNAGQFDILHLALHGVSDTVLESTTKLIFTQGTDSLENGFLHPYELYNLNLKASLAVLSACETGVGTFHKGEGVFSIGRAFAYAGCPSLVMSFWKVNDQVTSQLMKDFYETLINGKSIDKAFREAKIKYLKNSDEYTAHPGNWAAFVSSGDMSPVIQHPKVPVWMKETGTGLIIFPLLVFLVIRKKWNKTKLPDK